LPRVFHYFAYRVGDQQLAEDLAAATFERAWRKRNRYRKDLGKFQHWVFGIARKVAAEYFRRSESRLEIEVDENVSDGKDVEQVYEINADFAKLRHLLAQLGDEDRELLSLKYGAGMNNREISKLTGLSESNVGTKLHRLVTTLRDQWEQK
jgi:RNA polymerase sigma-70 factor, ECF subfamily